MKGFIEFVREQGVMGLAIGFILGGAVSKTVSALVEDVINPIIGLALGKVGNLAGATFQIGDATVGWGHFVSVLIDFLVVALVVYYGFKLLRLGKIDKPKNN